MSGWAVGWGKTLGESKTGVIFSPESPQDGAREWVNRPYFCFLATSWKLDAKRGDNTCLDLRDFRCWDYEWLKTMT